MIGLTWSSTKERTVSRTSFSSSERSASNSRKSTPGKRLKGDPPDAVAGANWRGDAAGTPRRDDSRPPAAAGAAEDTARTVRPGWFDVPRLRLPEKTSEQLAIRVDKLMRARHYPPCPRQSSPDERERR